MPGYHIVTIHDEGGRQGTNSATFNNISPNFCEEKSPFNSYADH